MIVHSCLIMLMAIASAYAQQKPNFVLILTDDQGFDDYGFRQPPLETPTMNKLASQGVQFTHFRTHATCAPTRSSLMTGRQFLRTGTVSCRHGGPAPHLDEYLLSQAMHDGGYATGMMGKWALGTSDADLPWNRGFDESWWTGKEYARGQGRYSHFNPPFFQNTTFAGVENGWQVQRITDKATDFIRRHKAEPFFLYLPYASPHEPWLCPKWLQDKYMKKGIGESYANLLGMLDHLDRQFKRILQVLGNHGLLDDTIVILFGDNGPTPKTRVQRQKEDGNYVHTGEEYIMNETEWAARNPTGLRGQKNTAWENGVRNRLSIYCPAKFSPKEVKANSVVMDIYPTLLDLAGITRKPDAPRLDGKSLAQFLTGTPSWNNKRPYLTGMVGTPVPHKADDGWYYRFTKQHSLPLHKRSTCLVLYPWVVINDKNEWGLYKLKKDPRQKNDLKKSRPQKFVEMRKKYYQEVWNVKQDPHSYSDPVQLIGLPGVDEPYLEMDYVYRWKGKNTVSYALTKFHEIGATQQLKVRVLKAASYKIWVYAKHVPTGTKLLFRTGQSKLTAALNVGNGMSFLGQTAFNAGDETITLKVLECDDLQALPKMSVYNLHLKAI